VKIGVLGLQGDVREHQAALEAAGAVPVVVKRPGELDGLDGLILPGGESTTIGLLLDRFGLLEPLRQRALDGMPLFGTCAGLILMATEIAGPDAARHRLSVLDVTVRRNAYGRQPESFEAEVAVAGRGGDGAKVRVAFIRAPVIERLGRGVEVLGEWEGSPVLVRQGHLLAASFHAEITGEHRVHEIFVTMAASGSNGAGRT